MDFICNGEPCAVPPYVYNLRQGRVLDSPSLCLVFWGTGLSELLQNSIGQFVIDVFQNSNYTDGWSEYGVLRRPILHPACGKGVEITPISIPPDGWIGANSLIAAELRAQAAAKHIAPITTNTHFVLFFSPEEWSDCSKMCNYHSFDSNDLTFSAIPDLRPTNPACNAQCVGVVPQVVENQEDWFQATKRSITRQVMGAATNPFTDAWQDPKIVGGGEIEDICAGDSAAYQDGISGHLVAKWYSQQAQACVTRHLDYVAEGVACGTYDRTTLEPIVWRDHPYDCTDQYDHSRCMFCKGWANGKIVRQCLPRLQASCNPTFNTVPRAAFCNLEFECGSSFVGFNVVLIFTLLLVVLML